MPSQHLVAEFVGIQMNNAVALYSEVGPATLIEVGDRSGPDGAVGQGCLKFLHAFFTDSGFGNRQLLEILELTQGINDAIGYVRNAQVQLLQVRHFGQDCCFRIGDVRLPQRQRRELLWMRQETQAGTFGWHVSERQLRQVWVVA